MLEQLEPRQLLTANLLAHWSAADLQESHVDGAVVEAWNDSSAGIRATGMGDPRLIHEGLMGRPVVRFVADPVADSFLVSAADSPMSGIEDFSIAVVFATSSNDLAGPASGWLSNTALVSASRIGTPEDWGLVLNREGQLGAGLGGPTQTVYSTAAQLNDGQGHVAIYTRNGGTITLYVDGLPAETTSNDRVDARAHLEMRFGINPFGINPYSGDLAELQIFDDDLSEAEANVVRTELLAAYDINTPPLATADRYDAIEDEPLDVPAARGVLQNDLDGNGDQVTAVLLEQPQHGQIELADDGSFIYQPDPNFFGVDTFTYAADDGQGTLNATVTIDVQSRDDRPHASPDRYLVVQDSTTSFSVEHGVLANDSSPDRETLTAFLVDDAQRGTLELNADGSFQYTPESGFVGEDSFVYRAVESTDTSEDVRVDLRLTAETVVVNELMASNEMTLETRVRNSVEDEFVRGTVITPDWFELKNRSNESVDLGGAFLTDSRQNLKKWQFPAGTTFPANGLLPVFASGLDISNRDLDENGFFHTNFRLGGPGEYLALVQPDGTIWHDLEFPEQFGDTAYGLSFDGEGTGYLLTPSLGADNPNEVVLLGPAQRVSHETLPPMGVTTVPLVAASDSAEYHVPDAVSGSALGLNWTDPQYVTGSNDETWSSGAGGFGFDDDDNFSGRFSTDLAAAMQNISSSVYLRYKFDVTDVDALTRLQLRLKYDDGLVAYLNGQRVLIRNTSVPALQPDDPLSLYTFDETAGLVAADSIGGRADANLHGFSSDDSQWVPGQVGGAVELDGESHWLLAPTPIADGARAMTFSGWVWADETVRYGTIVKNWGNSAPGQFHVGLLGRSGDLSNRLTDRVTVREGRDTPLPTGQWQHVALTYDGQFQKLFRNGQLIVSTENKTTLTQRSAFMGIGAKTDDDGVALARTPGLWNGKFDDFAFWGTALADEQIKLIYNQGMASEGVLAGASNRLFWDSSARDARADSAAVTAEVFDLTDFLALLKPTGNVLAIHAMNQSASDPDLLLAPELVGLTGSDQVGPLRVTSTVASNAGPIDAVTLHYRFMFGPEKSTPMFDDGSGADLVAGDGQYSAFIPAGFTAPGEMIRYYVTAHTDSGITSRAPRFLDREGARQSPEYFGTVAADPSLRTQLPVLHRFVENTRAADAGGGTRAAVFFDGEFYDNVFLRVRGASSRNEGKKSYKFEFNVGHKFQYAREKPRVTEFNLNTTFQDKAYIRQQLTYEYYQDAGAVASDSGTWRIQQNGQFFSVASFAENIDADMLANHGLDPDGALYKITIGNGVTSSRAGVEKKTRRHEDSSDLEELVEGVKESNPERGEYIFDSIDLPSMISYLTAGIISQDFDRFQKNFFVYRDTNGTGEWLTIGHDKDLTWGNRFFDDEISGNGFTFEQNTAQENRRAHPFQTAIAHNCCGPNTMNDALITHPRVREMYLRYLRTLMDQQLQPPDTPLEERRLEAQVDTMATALAPDAALDLEKWGAIYGDIRDFPTAIQLLKTNYFDERRVYLYETQGGKNGVGVPGPQIGNPPLNIGNIDFNPASGNQQEEFVQIINPHDFAVDISGWRMTGAVDFTFRPGTVIPSQDSIYVSPDVRAFRARTSGPSGGQQLFVQGSYQRRLPDSGGTVRMIAADGEEVTSQTYAGDEPTIHHALRISELHYNPANPTPEEAAAGHDNADDFEFIEMVNVGSETISLVDVSLIKVQIEGEDEGVEFHMFNAPITELQPGQHLLVVEDVAAFKFRYGGGLPVIGQWSGGLGNGGETVTLMAGNTIVHQFAYDDLWYPQTDGGGFSLKVIDPANQGQQTLGQMTNWRPSAVLGGTPGSDASSLPGDFNGDQEVNAQDIDLLYAKVNQMTDDLLFDLTGDGQVNSNDVDEQVQNILNTNYGDTDLDGDVDFTDFITLANMFGKPASSWSQADFDGDGMIGFGDFNLLTTNFGARANVQDGNSLINVDVVDKRLRRRSS